MSRRTTEGWRGGFLVVDMTSSEGVVSPGGELVVGRESQGRGAAGDGDGRCRGIEVDQQLAGGAQDVTLTHGDAAGDGDQAEVAQVAPERRGRRARRWVLD